MSKSIDDLYKEINRLSKDIENLDKQTSSDIAEIKKFFKTFDKKLSLVLSKIQEFEVIMDAAEIIEEHMEEEEEKYNTEWNPYDDEDYIAEDYEGYDEDEDNE